MSHLIKISNNSDAPNIAMGWATVVVSIYNDTSIARPQYRDTIKHHTMIINDDYTHLSIDPIKEYIEFITTLNTDDKILIHSIHGGSRSVSMIYIYYMIQQLTPPTALYEVRQINKSARPNVELIILAEQYLKLENQYSSFIKVWSNSTNTLDNIK